MKVVQIRFHFLYSPRNHTTQICCGTAWRINWGSASWGEWRKTNEDDPLPTISPPMTLGSKRSGTKEKRSSNIQGTHLEFCILFCSPELNIGVSFLQHINISARIWVWHFDESAAQCQYNLSWWRHGMTVKVAGNGVMGGWCDVTRRDETWA